MIYFIADTHFRHSNIIKYCNRPFADIDKHDEMLIHNWNATVRPRDEVYVLGDFIFARNQQDALYLTSRLNGKKHLILGNHDKLEYCEGSFEWIKDYHVFTAHNRTWVLFHYPIWLWFRHQKGAIHLYGHLHESTVRHDSLPDIRALRDRPNCYNVGVDVNDFRPVSALDLLWRSQGVKN